MVKKLKFQLLLLFSIIAVSACTQKHQSSSLNIGDAAPPLRVRRWIKGAPVQSFERGKVYVVDFWATWCVPCVASMPHLSELAHRYKGNVIFLAIDIWENKYRPHTTSQIKAFVDSMGHQMDFSIAVADSNFMVHHWMEASEENSIPCDFVVNEQGKIAWIGNPVDLDTVLLKISNNTWNIKEASSKRILNKHLSELDFKAANSMSLKWQGLDDRERADSDLLAIERVIQKEPRLKYAPDIAYITFWALLQTNPQKAYEYGKKVIVTSTYQHPAYESIIHNVEDPSLKEKISPEIYRLGAEAYQAEINNTNPVYRKLLDLPEIYHKMGAWYRLAQDTAKAREAEQKAIQWKNRVERTPRRIMGN